MKMSLVRRVLPAVSAVLFAGGVSLAGIRWLEKDYDFGLMREIAGPQTGHSRLVNEGPDTLQIFSVKPSCGCTSAEFSDAPIAPGDTAVISYTYNPEMRPGKFDKSVKVRFSNGERVSIKIIGNVLGTPESLSLLYPVDAGRMRISADVIDAEDVVFGRSPIFFVNAYSMSIDSVRPVVRSSSPGLILTPSATGAGPGDVITYSLNFDSRKHGQFGRVQIPVSFDASLPGDESEPMNLIFNAFVLPDTNALLTRQGNKHPSAFTESSVINIGTPSERQIKTEIVVGNRGDSPLQILAVSTPSDDFKAGRWPKEIKPGKTASVKLTIDRAGLPSGPFRLPVDIVTTDPDRPRTTVYITGNGE